MKTEPFVSGATDVSTILDGASGSHRRSLAVLVCFLIVAFEGFDAAVVGFVAPQVAANFSGTPSQVSAAIAAGMLGLLLGYLGSGAISDKRGRRPVLLAGTLLFSAASLASTLSGSLHELTAWRLVTGLGIGAAMPALAALLAEILPSGRKSAMLTAVFCGFLFGSALAGISTGHLIDHVGWRGMFVLGGIAPLLCVPAVFLFVPESPQYLVQSGAAPSNVRNALLKLGYSVSEKIHFNTAGSPSNGPRGGVRELFSPHLRQTTVLIWSLSFLILGSFYIIASWLPTLIRDAGVSVAVASRTAALFQSGGLAGAITAAFAIRKLAPLKFVWVALLAGAATPLWLASPDATSLYALKVFLAGFLISGPIVVISAVSAIAYPTSVRSAGVGWASSWGRLGSFASAGSIGWLVQSGIPLNKVIGSVALTVLGCAVIALLLSRALRGSGG